MDQRILIAGIGNIFLGDDAFGVEVARELSQRQLPENIKVVDFGIRGFDLAYAIMDGYDLTIFVDATARGGEPGTIYTIEPELNDPEIRTAQPGTIETHGMKPENVLRLVSAMGGEFKKILVVGCEPATFGPEDEGFMGLSEPVKEAVPEAVTVIENLLNQIQEEPGAKRSID